MDARRRLFTALRLEPELAGELAAQARSHIASETARFEPPEDLHLTLTFLGDVAFERCGEFANALERAARRARALELEVGRAGAFPSSARPHVLWVGVRDRGLTRLAELQAAVSGECRALGWEPEARAFVPHITLARARGSLGARAADEFFALDLALEWKPRAVSLVHTAADRGGANEPRYRTLAEFALPVAGDVPGAH